MNQLVLQSQLDAQKQRAIYAVKTDFKDANESDLKEIKGLGVMSIEALRANQIHNKTQLIAAGIDKIKEILNNPLTLKHVERFLEANVDNKE